MTIIRLQNLQRRLGWPRRPACHRKKDDQRGPDEEDDQQHEDIDLAAT